MKPITLRSRQSGVSLLEALLGILIFSVGILALVALQSISVKATTESKFREGYFHSGDLGHVRIANGKRYMFFNGRTDDWIRKDGENFSAENVLKYAQMMPDVAEAIAFGAPCEVSDEKVMVVVQMDRGKKFNPQATYDYFMKQQKEGGMDPNAEHEQQEKKLQLTAVGGQEGLDHPALLE